MARRRINPTNLRLLLLGALGGAVWACAGKTNECTDGMCPTGIGGAGALSSVPGCTDPVPMLEGADTGFYRCDEGHLWRHQALTCPSVLPRDVTVEWPDDGMGGAESAAFVKWHDECSTDADCPEDAACRLVHVNSPFSDGCLGGDPTAIPQYSRLCQQGCREDSDCAENEVCLCGPEIGECQAVSETAGCRQDSDCGAGNLCLENAHTEAFWSARFACQLPNDACDSNEDCSELQYCAMSASGRICDQASDCGRPFLVLGEVRKATASDSAAWISDPGDLDLTHVSLPTDVALRTRLAEHWTEIGLLEHASVAAFARFTLQLLAMGAPAELVELSQEAALDEIRHARLAFALASRYAGRDIGPGTLPIGGALDACNLEGILRLTVREGCIGETRAALEASRAAESCADSTVRAVLETIAADEARHAELAWRVVRWIVTTHPETIRVLAEEFVTLEHAERALPQRYVPRAETPSAAARYGLLEGASLEECHQVAHREVILPCARTMIASAAALAA